MAIKATWLSRNTQVYISNEAGALTLSIDGRENLSFDGEGRLVGAWINDITYRRGLDNRVLAKWVETGQLTRRQRRFLTHDERCNLLEIAYQRAHEIDFALHNHDLQAPAASQPRLPDIAAWLAQVKRWTWQRLESDAELFRAIYRPVSILPPDQYLAMVVQVTEGCSYNRCTFCTFYRDRPFRIKPQTEVEEHVQAVLRFFGQGLSVRRTLFLADANAIVIPQARLLPMLDYLNAAAPILPRSLSASALADWKQEHPHHLEGIYAFISAPDALRKDASDFAELKERNLHRVYVGLETGHDPLRSFLHKQGTIQDVLDAVSTMKAGGMSIGLILMVGIGGSRYKEVHFRDTVAAITRMPLTGNDIIYLSPFVDDGESPYSQEMAQLQLTPLSEEETINEEQRFKQALQQWCRQSGARVSRYDLREFVY